MKRPFACIALLAALPLAYAGEPVATPHDRLLDAIGRAPSARNIERDVRTLVGFGTRHTLSSQDSPTRGIGAATRWVKAEFERISAQCGGCLEVIEVSDVVTAPPMRRSEIVQMASAFLPARAAFI